MFRALRFAHTPTYNYRYIVCFACAVKQRVRRETSFHVGFVVFSSSVLFDGGLHKQCQEGVLCYSISCGEIELVVSSAQKGLSMLLYSSSSKGVTLSFSQKRRTSRADMYALMYFFRPYWPSFIFI